MDKRQSDDGETESTSRIWQRIKRKMSLAHMENRTIETWDKIVIAIDADPNDDEKRRALLEIERVLSNACPIERDSERLVSEQMDDPSANRLPQDLSAEIDRISAERRKCDAATYLLKRALDDSTENLRLVEGELQVARMTIDLEHKQARERMRKMTERTIDLENSLVLAHEKMQAAQARVGVVTEQSEHRLKLTQDRSDIHDRELKRTQHELQSALRNLRVVEEQKGQLSREIRVLQRESDEWRTRTAREHSTQITEMGAQLRDVVVRTRVECDQRVDSCQHANEAKRNESEQLHRQNISTMHADFTSSLGRCEETVASLTKRMHVDHEEHDELQVRSKRLIECEEQRKLQSNGLSSVHEKLRRISAESDQHLASKQAECDALNARIAHLQMDSKMTNDAHATFQREVETLTRILQAASNESNERMRHKTEQYTRRLGTLQRDLVHLEAHLQATKTELRNCRKRLDEALVETHAKG